MIKINGVCDKNRKPLLTIEDIQLYILELEEQILADDKERESFLAHIDELEEQRKKIITLIEKLYKMANEQDSDNVNLIDRLENILKTLKGE